MSVAAIALGNLCSPYGSLSAGGCECDNFAVNPTACISGFARGRNNRSNPARKMFRRRQLAPKPFRDRNRGKTQHIPVPVVLPYDAGAVHGVDEVVRHLAREA